MEAIFFKFQRFFQGFLVCFVQMLSIQTLSACYFISEERLSCPVSGDMIILCVE